MTCDDLFANNRAWAAQVEREKPGFFAALERQQRPRYMWIGCSDSRVPANQITGLEPGEVFVHRNVANIVAASDLNALSALQYAVEMLKVRHVMVVGHYGCGGVMAAYQRLRVGLADNWLRHVQAVRDRHDEALISMSDSHRLDALVELNVIEQVANVCGSTVMADAWASGQAVTVHGWAYGLRNGLLTDLSVSISSADELPLRYAQAVRKTFETRK